MFQSEVFRLKKFNVQTFAVITCLVFHCVAALWHMSESYRFTLKSRLRLLAPASCSKSAKLRGTRARVRAPEFFQMQIDSCS